MFRWGDMPSLLRDKSSNIFLLLDSHILVKLVLFFHFMFCLCNIPDSYDKPLFQNDLKCHLFWGAPPPLNSYFGCAVLPTHMKAHLSAPLLTLSRRRVNPYTLLAHHPAISWRTALLIVPVPGRLRRILAPYLTFSYW